jgi:hypothetical protein
MRSKKRGDLLLQLAEDGDPSALEMVQFARSGGATDDDIRRTWNTPSYKLERLERDQNFTRGLLYKGATMAGASHEEALDRVSRIVPLMGGPDFTKHHPDETLHQGQDKPLCLELWFRISDWMEKQGLDPRNPRSYEQLGLRLGDQYPTINSLIRDEMQNGTL